MLALIDCDPLVYASGFAAEKDGIIQPVQNALHNLDTAIENLQGKFSGCKYFISGDSNWRKELDSTYKANRKDMPKPVYYLELRDRLILKYKANVSINMEADDAIGIEATKEGSENKCVVSIDKDLDQITGHHYHPKKDISYFVDEVTGLRNFYKQVLTGDRVDNISGIYGLGPVTAEKLLGKYTTEKAMWNMVKYKWYESFEDGHPSGKSVSEALKNNAQLLWISRFDRQRWEEPK